MPVYDINLTDAAAGLDADIFAASDIGNPDREPIGDPVTLDEGGAAQVTLGAGDYIAVATNENLALENMTTNLVFNQLDSIAAGGGAPRPILPVIINGSVSGVDTGTGAPIENFEVGSGGDLGGRITVTPDTITWNESGIYGLVVRRRLNVDAGPTPIDLATYTLSGGISLAGGTGALACEYSSPAPDAVIDGAGVQFNGSAVLPIMAGDVLNLQGVANALDDEFTQITDATWGETVIVEVVYIGPLPTE